MIGQKIADRYEVLRKLGAGGMAIVYLAKDEKNNREVALKVMSPQVGINIENVKRFEREFEVCRRLDHENIISLYELGQLEDDTYYYTMDYLPHPSLDDILKKKGKLSPQRTLKMMQQVATAMSCYHAEGIIHRDLKPGNIVVTPDDNCIVVDFGLVTDENLTALTRTGTVLGTPYYMSPEMVLGERVTIRADIYALGVIGFEALTGTMPFQGNDFSELYSQIIAAKRKAPTDVIPSLDKRWNQIMNGCLAKDQEMRFENSEALLEALSELRLQTQKNEQTKVPSKSGLSTTGVQRPVLEDSTVTVKPRLRWPAPQIVLLLFFMFTLAYLTKRDSGELYVAKGIRVLETPSSLIVTWESPRAYSSRVKLEEGSAHRVIANEKQEQTKKHKVTIAPLPPRKSYRLRILFPDGTTSLPHQATTKALTINNLQSSKSEEVITVSWQMDYGNSAYCIVHRRLGVEDEVPLLKKGNKWQLELPFADEVVSLKAKVNLSKNTTVTLDLGKELARLVHGPTEKLNRLDGRKLTLQVDKKASEGAEREYEKLKKLGKKIELDDVSRIRRSYSGKALKRKSEELNLIGIYKQLSPLCSLSLNSRLLPFDERVRIYDSVIKLYELSCYSNSLRLNPSFALPHKTDLGMFNQRFGRLARPTRSITLYELTKETANLRFGPPRVHFYKRPITKKPFNIKLPDIQNIKKAALYIRVQSFSHMVIRIRVNNRISLYLNDVDLYGGTRTGQRLFSQPIPRELLRRGNNDVTLHFEKHFTDMGRSGDIQLKHVAFDLWHFSQ